MINFDAWLVPITGLLFMIYFSYQDYKYMEVENEPIVMFFLFAFGTCILVEKSWIVGALMMATLILGLILWNFKSIGGADAKILPAMIPFILIGAENYYVRFGTFLIAFAFVGAIYGLISKYYYKKEEIAFIPAMTFTYILMVLINKI